MTTIEFFHAEWCHPCSEQEPIIESIDNEHEGVTVSDYDIEDDEAMEVANQYNVRSVPTTIVKDDERVVEQFVGLTSKDDIENSIDK